MPWRKYKQKEGKHGPIYHVARGIQVRQDARGKWTLFLEKGGMRKNRTIGSGREGLTKAIKIAEEIAAKLDTFLPYEQRQEESSRSTSEFIPCSKAWLEGNSGKWSSYTYERYETILRLHIWPDKSFKNKRIDEISRKDIRSFLKKLYKVRSAATVETTHSILSGIYEELVEDEHVITNPASGLLKRILPEKRQRNQKDSEPFTIYERDVFLSQAEKTCSWGQLLILKVMAFAGLRLGESLAMRFRNLDFDNKAYHVMGSFKQHRFSKPKKGKMRWVDLPEFLVEDFRNYIHHLRKEGLKQGKGSAVDLLFIDPKESGDWPFSQRKIQAMVKRVCKQAKLDIRNPHDLRHTYASILLMAHQSPAYVQKQLGHSSISITVDIYGHWVSGEGRNGLDEALQARQKSPNIYVQNLGENRI